KSFPFEGAANIKYPTLTVAALQFHARAYPAIVPSRAVVKGKVVGYDPNGEKMERAERIGKHMTYQVLEEMTEWEDDMDRGLLVMPIVGIFFKKSYYDPHEGRNISKAVWAQNLVMDYEAESLDRAPRKSEEFELYDQDIIERVRAGIWIEPDLEMQDEEKPELFIEQHTSLDLDEDGYKEPYVVTVHKDTATVVRITARYDEDAIFIKDGKNLITIGGKKREVREYNEQVEQQNMESAMLAEQARQSTG
ncbi:unnamed protein product, partial [marine sediment metagenome]